jgi:hypothetical protein
VILFQTGRKEEDREKTASTGAGAGAFVLNVTIG